MRRRSPSMDIRDFRLPAQWMLLQSEASLALYQNAQGDTLSIHFFDKAPDIAADLSDVDGLRAFYRGAAESNGVAMLEVDPTRIGALPAVRTLLKARLQPTGVAFVGSYTLPFADRSYVLKIQGVESCVTGLREAAVLAMQPIQVDEDTGRLLGWEQDPYDPSHEG